MFALTMPLCIFAPILLLFFILSFSSSIRTVTEYVFAVIVILLGLVTLFVLLVLFCNITQSLLGSIPSGHFILRYLEKRVKAQLNALHPEEIKASRLIQEHLKAIDQWDDANALLLNEIRDAEVIIRSKGLEWTVVPDRDRRSKTLGSTFFIHGPWSPRPREDPEPSACCLVRWLRDEDDPRVWAAKAKVTHQNGVLSDKRAVLARLQGENEDLTAKSDDAVKKRKAVQWGPRQPKPTRDTWTERQLSFLNRPRPTVTYQPAPVHIQTNTFHYGMDFTNERIHFCEFCEKDGHRWRFQYDSLVTASAAPFERMCPTANARPKPRPYFVSAVPAGGQSLFDPDVGVAPHCGNCSLAPAPLPVAQTFPPPAPLFSAPPEPLFSAPPATLVPAQAAAPLFSAPQVQLSVPIAAPPPAPQVPASVLVTPPPPVPQISQATPASKPSAAPIVLSTTPPCTPPPCPAPATPAAPIAKRAPAAPRGRGPPSVLQIVWPGQTTAGPAASAARDAALEKARNEQEMAALVKEEAESRAAEKAMGKRQKQQQMSTPQVEKKKNYRF